MNNIKPTIQDFMQHLWSMQKDGDREPFELNVFQERFLVGADEFTRWKIINGDKGTSL